MSKIVDFPGKDSKDSKDSKGKQEDYSPDALFERLKGKFKNVIIIGTSGEGEEDIYYCMSLTHGPDILWMLKQFEYDIMHGSNDVDVEAFR